MAMPYWDLRLEEPPADRGCGLIVLDTQALLNKGARDVRVAARDPAGRGLPPAIRVLDGTHLQVLPEEQIVDYLLK